jgi:hypothetical protein
VRVDVNTDMDKMEELMMHVWGLEKPNLLISVTGGASSLEGWRVGIPLTG